MGMPTTKRRASTIYRYAPRVTPEAGRATRSLTVQAASIIDDIAAILADPLAARVGAVIPTLDS